MASNPYEPSGPADSATPKKISRVLIAVGIIGALIVLVPLGLCIGFLALLMAEGRAYHEQFLREEELVTPILADDPAFKDIETRQTSVGRVSLDGEVATQTDADRLQRRLEPTFGKKRADELAKSVHIREYHERYLHEQALVAPVLASDPAFRNVIAMDTYDSGAYLFGDVPSEADLNRLKERLEPILGRERAAQETRSIVIRGSGS